MATKTFIVTVPAGIGGGFYIDGVQKPTLDLAVDATYRFDQSDSTNAFHPINFSATSDGTHGGGTKYTTNVTEVGTPGNSGAYTEITLSSSTPNPLYYYCQNHSGMGGQLDLNSDSWGALSWSVNSWGNQDEAFVFPTGVTATSSVASVDAFPNQGWGSDSWGVENWGESGNQVILTGLDLTIGFGAKEAWNEKTWGDSETEWGGPYIPTVRIGQQIVETGEEINSTVASVSITTATEIFLSQNPLDALDMQQGQVGDRTDAFPTGQELSLSLGTAIGQNEQGWGRDDWGAEVWGAEGIWVTAEVTGNSLSVDSGIRETWGQDEWGASTTEWGGVSITDVDISVNANVTSEFTPGWGAEVAWGAQSWGQATVDMSMSMSEGTVDPAPDTDITGVQLNTTVNAVSIQANADLTVTGQQLNITLGDENSEAITIASPTGIELTTTMGVPTAGLSVLVEVTGVTSTTSTGIIGLNAWELVDSGTSPTWTVVDKAA